MAREHAWVDNFKAKAQALRLKIARAESLSDFEALDKALRKLVDDISEAIEEAANLPVTSATVPKDSAMKQFIGEDFVSSFKTSNPRMNRSSKGVAVKALMQNLEKVKDEAYDSLFDVTETIDRMKRRGN